VTFYTTSPQNEKILTNLCEWISKVMTRGSVAVKVNDNLGHYFQTRKGVRHGDPLSPILINIVVDMLAILIL